MQIYRFVFIRLLQEYIYVHKYKLPFTRRNGARALRRRCGLTLYECVAWVVIMTCHVFGYLSGLFLPLG